jgi:hypothetical protein
VVSRSGLYASEGTVRFANFRYRGTEANGRIRFGAVYFAEYQRQPDLDADFDLMAKAGFSLVEPGVRH